MGLGSTATCQPKVRWRARHTQKAAQEGLVRTLCIVFTDKCYLSSPICICQDCPFLCRMTQGQPRMLCSFSPAIQSLDFWCFQASEQERALREFMCKLCSGVLSEPVSAPCGHHFCRPCLDKHFQVHCHAASGEQHVLSSLCWLTAAHVIHVTWLLGVALLLFKAWYSVYTAFDHFMYSALPQKHTSFFLLHVPLTWFFGFVTLPMEQNSHKLVCVRHSHLHSAWQTHAQVTSCQESHPLAQDSTGCRYQQGAAARLKCIMSKA